MVLSQWLCVKYFADLRLGSTSDKEPKWGMFFEHSSGDRVENDALKTMAFAFI